MPGDSLMMAANKNPKGKSNQTSLKLTGSCLLFMRVCACLFLLQCMRMCMWVYVSVCVCVLVCEWLLAPADDKCCVFWI